MRVVIRKVDMDTALAGLLLGADGAERIEVRPAGALAGELVDAAVLCIEAGGAGEVDQGNFDHHEAGRTELPACVQAAQSRGVRDARTRRLVDYVAAVDTGRPIERALFPTLSNVFSGMLLVTREPRQQFQAGMALLQTALLRNVDPFATMPDREEWRPFIAAKRQAQATLAADLDRAVMFTTASGATAGLIQTSAPGALGGLYEAGCRYGIAAGLNGAGETQPRKVTIGARNGWRLSRLLPLLEGLESGWGGPSHGSIIGSPPSGTSLSLELLQDLIRRNL